MGGFVRISEEQIHQIPGTCVKNPIYNLALHIEGIMLIGMDIREKVPSKDIPPTVFSKHKSISFSNLLSLFSLVAFLNTLLPSPARKSIWSAGEAEGDSAFATV